MTDFPIIYVVSHPGIVSSSIIHHLLASGHPEFRINSQAHAKLDLTNKAAVNVFIAFEKPSPSQRNEMIDEMVGDDLEEAKGHDGLKRYGYAVVV